MHIYNRGAVLAIAGSALVSTIAVGATFAPSTLAAFTDTTVSTGNTAAAGTLNIDIVDNGGNVKSTATVAVANASPSMGARSYTLSLKNSGSLNASMRVHATNITHSSASLDDVLLVQVLNQLSQPVYSGKISGLEFTQAELPSNTTSIYTIKVTWPDEPGVEDNPYQGATLSFDLTADASVIAGQ